MYTLIYRLKRTITTKTITLFDISKFLLACLLLSININGNNFFHTKELFFVLLVVSSIRYVNLKNIWTLLFVLMLYIYSATFNLLTESDYELSKAIYYMLGFIYLYLNVFVIKNYRRTIINAFMFSAIFVAIITLVVWIICRISPVIATGLQIMFGSENAKNAAFIFLIRKRQILGTDFYGVYYCTAPCMICALGYCLGQNLKQPQKQNSILAILFSFTLIMSAAKANILVVALIVADYLVIKLLQKKKIVRAFLVIFILGTACLILLVSLALQKDSSATVKANHVISYKEVFDDNPIKMLLVGWGPGSQFYSKGFASMTDTTEMSFYETIRRYGFLSTIMIFLVVFGKPVVYAIQKKIKPVFTVYYSIVLAGYIFVACTNPFLLGSIGFCSLFFIEAIIQECHYEMVQNINYKKVQK